MNKKHSFRTLGLAVAMLLGGLTAQAQQPETSIYINGILPVSQFNDPVELAPLGTFVPMDRDNIAMGATVGLGATARWGMWFDVGFGQLLPFAEASFLWNASKRSVRDMYDENTHNNEVQEIPSAPVYFNVPILLGLKYRYPLTPMIRPFAEMSIGYDLLFISSNGYKKSGPWYSYKPSGELGWSIGAGTYLGEFVSVGLYYMGLGRHKIDYTNRCKANNPDPEIDNYNPVKRRIGELGIRVGFHF